MSTKPKSYKIETLNDILRLPTIHQVNKCLLEIGTTILAARAEADEVVANAHKMGITSASIYDISFDSMEWIDDDKGNIDMTMKGTVNGEPVEAISFTRKFKMPNV